MKKLIPAARLALSGMLVYQVYLEAGVFTAICIGLIGLGVELNTLATEQLKVSLIISNKIDKG